ncbi:SRPBCC domain-containing protein [Natronosalvus rutilus]|uniref:SRPBCC domain-containing protein n=1 Tax=Natronosalvus rutilus TaxID=2953753 RepID=A0A9E7N5D7_9EURY|nr:SRPBCC domain-containing protein [Natronosalvus rutilus]UTF52049.1 SRPBCC domain-containing protein [Natronosalvus rutilus]
MEQLEVFETIDAPPETVWQVLLEFDAYPEWNPFLRSVEGLPVEGERLSIRVRLPGGRTRTIRTTVLTVETNRRIVWLGRLGVPFAFDGYHEFHLEPIDGGRRTRLLQRETFRGALVPVLFHRRRIERGFRAMNRALRNRAERRVRATV